MTIVGQITKKHIYVMRYRNWKTVLKLGDLTPFLPFVTKTHIDQYYEPFFCYNLYCQQFD